MAEESVPANGGSNAEPETTNLLFKVRAVKGGQPRTLEGKIAAVSVEGIKDSFLLVALRDSRIFEIEIRNEAGRLLWSLIPGTLRSALDKGGLSPDIIQGLGGRK